MSDDRIQDLRQMLRAGKTADEKLNPERVFLRGFNEGIAYAEMQVDKVFGKEGETNQ